MWRVFAIAILYWIDKCESLKLELTGLRRRTNAQRRRGGTLVVSRVSAVGNAGLTKSFKLYNTMTRSKETFTPSAPPKVSFYSCGPTVYDYAHIGNFRAFLTYDILKASGNC